MGEIWVVNSSPIITLAKAGHLEILEPPATTLLIPEAVAAEILAGPPDDPARKALESGWGHRVASGRLPNRILEWGLGAGETAVLSMALEEPGRMAVLDDAAARTCARTFGIPLLGTLGAVLRAKREGLIESAARVVAALRAAGLRLDDKTIRTALERGAQERWGS